MNGEHWRDYFDSDHIGSWDLPKDRDTVMTIAKVVRGVLEGQKGKKSSKAIITFVRAKKTFAANVTNCKTIARLYGNAPAGWVGKQIALYVAEDVDSPQGPVDAVRVRPRVPQAKAAPAKPNGNGNAPAASAPESPPQEAAASEPEWQPEEPPMGVLESDHEQAV